MGVRSGKRRQLKPPSEYQVPTTFVRSRRANGEPKGGKGIDPKLTPPLLSRERHQFPLVTLTHRSHR